MAKKDIALEKRHGHSLVLVRIIAVTKLVKSALLLIVGFFIVHMLYKGHNAPDTLRGFVNDLRFDENNGYIHSLLEKSIGISQHKLEFLSVGTLIYSILYGIEGIGLAFDKGWAEWMTVITTAGFIPLEVYEICKHATLVRVVVLIANILILIYISMRLRWRHFAKLENKTADPASIAPELTTPAGIEP